MGRWLRMSTTIWGSFQGASPSYIRPYIEVSWTQNVANNTSTVTASLYFHRYTNNYWSYNEYTDSRGHSSTFKIGDSTVTQIRPFNLSKSKPPNRELIWTRTQTVNHNSSGTGSVYISAGGNTNVNPARYSFGQTVTLPTIARETTLNSASIAGNLVDNTANTVNLSVTRRHSSYTMDYEIYAGNTRISRLTGEGVRTSLTLTQSMVNSIINTMPNSVTRNLQLRVTTRNSSGNQVGSTQTRNFSVRLDNNSTRPTISQVSTSVAGDGHDSTIGRYVQGISRLAASFRVDWGRGASGRSRSMDLNGSNFGSGALSNATYSGTSTRLTVSGNRTLTMTAVNSRGQTVSVTRTINVMAYQVPVISTFTGTRSTTNSTTIVLNRATTFNSLGGLNKQTVKIERRRAGTSKWIEIWSLTTTSPVNSSTNSTDNATTHSYDFKFTVTDQFGSRATAELTVSTAGVLLAYNEDKGVGVGKFHEKGVLDVGGDVYVAGDIKINGDSIVGSGSNANGQWVRLHDGTQICWGASVGEIETQTTSGSLFMSSGFLLTYARPFIGSPAVYVGTRGSNASWATTGSVTHTATFVYLMGTSNGMKANIGYQAIGRWK